VVSEDGSALDINPYSHYTDSTKGIGTEHIVNISDLNLNQVKELLKTRGVKHKDEVAEAAAPAAGTAAASEGVTPPGDHKHGSEL